MLLTKLLQQGQLLRRKDRSAAMNCLEQCVQEAGATGDRRLLINSLTELALLIIEIGQPGSLQRSKNLLLRAEALLIGCTECEHESAYLLYCRGILYFQQRNFVDSLIHLRSAYRAYGQDLAKLSHTDDALGLYYASLGDFQAALFHLERSLSRRQTLNEDRDSGISYVYLGQIQLQMSQYDQAEHYFQRGLEAADAWEDRYLQIKTLTGLGQVAIEREYWENALAFLQKALKISQQPLDLSNVTYLHLSLAEVQLGQKQYVEAQSRIETEVIPHFQNLNDPTGLAIAKRTLGKILSRRLQDGIDPLVEDFIETAEDYFFEASMIFEELSMPQEYSRTLYYMADMYKACINSKHKYQYKGKAVRALELSLGILEKVNYGTANLIFQIEVLLNRIDQTVWLERAMSRLRGRKLLAEGSRTVRGQNEEATLLFIELFNHDALVQHASPDEVMQLLNIYLRSMSEVIQKYKGIISYSTGDGLMVVFQSSRDTTKSTDTDTDGLEVKLPSTEQVNLHHALRATLTAQEMLMRMQNVNEELYDRGLPAQHIHIGINSGNVLIGNVDTFTKFEFITIGSAVNSTINLCQAATSNQIRLSQSTYTLLRRVLSSPAIAVTKISDKQATENDNLGYILDELSFYGQHTNKPAWLINAEFPAIVRLGLTVQTELEEVALTAITAIVSKLGFSSNQGQTLVSTLSEIYQEVMLHTSEHTEMLLLFLPEESKLEILVSLEELNPSELNSIKEALGRMRHRQGFNSLPRINEIFIETTVNSLAVRLVQLY